MKYIILILTLFTISCAPVRYWQSQDPAFKPQVVGGTAETVAWACKEDQMNDKLIWIECEFHNRSYIKTVDSVCLEVSYTSFTTQKEVAKSRKVCSGVLTPNEKTFNYAAFIKKQRELLISVCGLDNSSCYMSAAPFTTSYNVHDIF